MKKLLLITILVFLTSVCMVHAQSNWEVGGELGLNLSTTSGQWGTNDETKNKWIGTPVFGVNSSYSFNPMIALVAGLYMIKSGALYVNTYEDGEYSQRERFTTLRLPVMARFMWGTTWQYYGLIGLYVSKRLCGRYVYKSSWGDDESGKIRFKKNPDEENESNDWILNTQDYRRLNVGLQIGGGIRRALGPGYLSFNLLFGITASFGRYFTAVFEVAGVRFF